MIIIIIISWIEKIKFISIYKHYFSLIIIKKKGLKNYLHVNGISIQSVT